MFANVFWKVQFRLCAMGYYAGAQNLRMCRHDFRAAAAGQQEGERIEQEVEIPFCRTLGGLHQ